MAKNVFKILVIIFLAVSLKGYSSEIVPNKCMWSDQKSQKLPEDSVKRAQQKEKKSKKKSPENKNNFNRKRISFETFDQNYEKALKYYDNGQYLSAARLFEELYPLSMGTPLADTLLFYFADCYYKNKDYEMAAFHFKDYSRRYPGTERTELAHYMCVKAIFEVSPIYSLDQSSTYYAIDEVNMFIQLYPKSQYVEECNVLLDLLREKLAKKELEMVKLYYYTDHFEATQITTKNFLKEYSYSKYAPEAISILVKNNYEYAKKSIESKKVERFKECWDAYETLKIHYPTSSYVAEVVKIAEDAKKQIEKNQK